MKLYQIGGLGADERVFRYLDLDCDTQTLNWIEPIKNEDLKSYTNRLQTQIDQTEDFGILEVSFGGIVAIELSKLCKPKKLILVSSVEHENQLSKLYLLIGRSGIIQWLPNRMIKPPKFILGFVFGTQNKKLIRKIVDDTKPEFIRWALNQIINWKSKSTLIVPVRIHGTNDFLIPLKGKAITVIGGGHFMIVDRAEEISNLVNLQMMNAG